MKRTILSLLLAVVGTVAVAQGLVKGRILDKNGNTPIEFINVALTSRADTTRIIAGTMTDTDGRFQLSNLAEGDYMLTTSMVGYNPAKRFFSVSSRNLSHSYIIYMSEDARALKAVTVTGMRSAMKLEVDRKSFDVSQLITNSGDAASDVLQNIPSVEVDNEGNISLRGNSSVEVWINGKASGLTTDNRAEILQQLPAESIDHIEVIDNPSAKFSAEGSAGIINIVLKKDRKGGYYGSLQAGADTRGGANTSFNINYNSPRWDAYLNIGYRHRENKGHSESSQEYTATSLYQRYAADNINRGNNLFSRAGITLHATPKDDISLSGMLMKGKRKSHSLTPYHYGSLLTGRDTRMMTRLTHSDGDMNMLYGEINYRHNFTDRHFIDLTIDFNRWKADNSNVYQDSTEYYDGLTPSEYGYQSRPMHMNNRSWEVKLDYENPISERLKLQAGYQGNFSHENTPQESYIDDTHFDGREQALDEAFYNRFIYDMDLHALYATLQFNTGKFGLMAGLRGEYWRVNTESYTYEQEQDPTKRDRPFEKDYFQLFPSLFLSYQLTPNDQLQLNYTRRLRRPWGGQLNSFRDTRDATTVSYGNPELTPEFSNAFSVNYLKTWTQHSLLVSAYYRPTTDIMQRVSWQNLADGLMYSTSFNLAKSQSAGLEATLKNRFFKFLDLTTTANAYYYKLDGFSYDIDGQTVTGDPREQFTWSARIMASLKLPYDISLQTSGNYRSRQSIAQGHRNANFTMDFGARKTFFNRTLTLAISCRDLLNTRKMETFTGSDTFTRHQINRWGGRKVNFTVSWNFGNMKAKKNQQNDGMQQPGQNDEGGQGGVYDSGMGE